MRSNSTEGQFLFFFKAFWAWIIYAPIAGKASFSSSLQRLNPHHPGDLLDLVLDTSCALHAVYYTRQRLPLIVQAFQQSPNGQPVFFHKQHSTGPVERRPIGFTKRSRKSRYISCDANLTLYPTVVRRSASPFLDELKLGWRSGHDQFVNRLILLYKISLKGIDASPIERPPFLTD